MSLLKNTHPKLLHEVNWEETCKIFPGLYINELSSYSSNKIAWNCKNGHVFWCVVSSRSRRNTSCYMCRSLAHLYPNLTADWSKNNLLSPLEVAAMSNSKYEWVCTNNHFYLDTPAHKTLDNRGCPYCSGRRVILGETDLLTLNPILAKEWHPNKNNKRPSDVSEFSHYDAWWVCAQGHEWKAKVSNRSNGRGCRQCSQQGVSKIEKRLASIIEQSTNLEVIEINALTECKWSHRDQKIEVDLILLEPIQNKYIFVEIDGSFWHRNREKLDILKTKLLIDYFPDDVIVRIRCEDLGFLPIENNKLIQLRYDWSYKDNELYNVAKNIENITNNIYREGLNCGPK